jgi:hypothetical protein
MQVIWIHTISVVLLLTLLERPTTVHCQESNDPITSKIVSRLSQIEILRELQGAIDAIPSVQCRRDFNETIAGIEARHEWAVASKCVRLLVFVVFQRNKELNIS